MLELPSVQPKLVQRWFSCWFMHSTALSVTLQQPESINLSTWQDSGVHDAGDVLSLNTHYLDWRELHLSLSPLLLYRVCFAFNPLNRWQFFLMGICFRLNNNSWVPKFWALHSTVLLFLFQIVVWFKQYLGLITWSIGLITVSGFANTDICLFSGGCSTFRCASGMSCKTKDQPVAFPLDCYFIKSRSIV